MFTAVRQVFSMEAQDKQGEQKMATAMMKGLVAKLDVKANQYALIVEIVSNGRGEMVRFEGGVNGSHSLWLDRGGTPADAARVMAHFEGYLANRIAAATGEA